MAVNASGPPGRDETRRQGPAPSRRHTESEHEVRSATSLQPPKIKTEPPMRAARPNSASAGMAPVACHLDFDASSFHDSRWTLAPSVPPRISSPSEEWTKGPYAIGTGSAGPDRQAFCLG